MGTTLILTFLKSDFDFIVFYFHLKVLRPQSTASGGKKINSIACLNCLITYL